MFLGKDSNWKEFVDNEILDILRVYYTGFDWVSCGY